MASESEAVGERIRAAREAKGLSQTELAVAIGVRQQSIAKIEAGGGTKLPRLALIAQALDTTTDALLGYADSTDYNSRLARMPDSVLERINKIIDAEERKRGLS